MKSAIKSKKPIKFGQELLVTDLASPNVDEYVENLKRANPNITHEELNKEVMEIVKQDSFYHVVMDQVSSAYEFDLDEEEVKEIMDSIAASKTDWSVEKVRSVAEHRIYRDLLYEDLQKDWEIVLDDDYVKNTLERFYQETGQPIREYLMDPQRFEGVRRTLVDKIITSRLLNAFRPIYKFPQQ